MTNLTNLDIKESVFYAVHQALTSPLLWSTPYYVYTETDLEGLQRGTQPLRPAAVLLAPRRSVELRFLPAVIVETDIQYADMELGSGPWRQVQLALHVVARSEAQNEHIREVLVGYLSKEPVSFYKAPIQPGDQPLFSDVFDSEWRVETVAVPQELMNEGTLRHWTVSYGQIVVPPDA